MPSDFTVTFGEPSPKSQVAAGGAEGADFEGDLGAGFEGGGGPKGRVNRGWQVFVVAAHDLDDGEVVADISGGVGDLKDLAVGTRLGVGALDTHRQQGFLDLAIERHLVGQP